MWRESAALGNVYAATTLYERGQEPRNVVLVDLDEGFRMMTTVHGLAEETVPIGLRVRLEVRPAVDGAEPAVIGTPLEEHR